LADTAESNWPKWLRLFAGCLGDEEKNPFKLA
jgi:hypothetical protein